MSFFSNDDDDMIVIALWIIAIGFIILAIDKTTKLNNPPAKEDAPPSCPGLAEAWGSRQMISNFKIFKNN